MISKYVLVTWCQYSKYISTVPSVKSRLLVPQTCYESGKLLSMGGCQTIFCTYFCTDGCLRSTATLTNSETFSRIIVCLRHGKQRYLGIQPLIPLQFYSIEKNHSFRRGSWKLFTTDKLKWIIKITFYSMDAVHIFTQQVPKYTSWLDVAYTRRWNE